MSFPIEAKAVVKLLRWAPLVIFVALILSFAALSPRFFTVGNLGDRKSVV